MEPPDPPPLAQAVAWVSRITTVAVMMVLPGIVGGWIDSSLGTGWIAPVGLAIGLAAALWMLVNFTKTPFTNSMMSRHPSRRAGRNGHE